MPIKSKLKFTKLYFPGLISLACLPLMLVINAVWTGKLDRPRMLEAVNFSKANIREYTKNGYFNVKPDYLDSKAELLYNLNSKNSAIITHLLYNASKTYTENKQANLWLKIELTPQPDYKDVVSVLDACNYLGSDFGELYSDNELFIWKIKHGVNEIALHPAMIDDIVFYRPKPSFWEKLKAGLKDIAPIKPLLLLLLLFILMYTLHFTGKGKLQMTAYRKRLSNIS